MKEAAAPGAREARTLDLELQGLTCAGCVRAVETAIRGVEGVEDVSVSLVEKHATVEARGAEGKLREELIRAVEASGFSARPARTAMRELTDEEAPETQGWVRRFWVGVALGLPVLVQGHASFLLPGEAAFLNQPWALRLAAVLSGCVLCYSGGPFFAGAWSALRHRRADMNTLVALGTSAAWLYSIAALLPLNLIAESSRHAFFEAVVVIIVLVLLGRMIEDRAKQRTRREVRLLVEMVPETVRLVTKSGTRSVALDRVKRGDRLLVLPGERVPLDGLIVDGETELDESLLTGEPLPVRRGVDDEVVGGAVNGDGAITVKTRRLGSEGELARIARMVRRAQASKPAVQRMVDGVAAWFVPAVALVAIIAFCAWQLLAPEGVDAIRTGFTASIAVLVIACPCALGLATPISIMVAVGEAAARGVLVRNGAALETARRANCLLIDKTGTITKGRPEVRDFHGAPGEDPRRVLRVAAGVAALSTHPLSKAIAAYASDQGVEPAPAKDIRAAAGLGIRGVVEGERTLLGSVQYLLEHRVDAEALDLFGSAVAAVAESTVLVAIGGRLAGRFRLEDAVRPEAPDAIRRIQEMGVEVAMASGDRLPVARRVADEVGIKVVRADLRPEDKLQAVQELKSSGRFVAMAGDGVNDAPALAAADVAIAMGEGSHAAKRSAHATLKGNSLQGIVALLEISRLTRRNIFQNLAGAFSYNALGIPIAAGALYPLTQGLLSPAVAGAAMAFSSVTVVFNASRLRRRIRLRLPPVP